MKKTLNGISAVMGIFLLTFVLSALPQRAVAHCDTLDGPVVTDAKTALDRGDVTPVLKWVKPADEAEIRQAFFQTVRVRGLNADARKLADFYFFETVVRIHRAGEGVPYTGLKAAGAEVDPGIAAADKSLATGKAAPVIAMVQEDVAKGITLRFEHAMELKRHMNESVDQGRKYVEAYVEYIHYVERLVGDASGKASEHVSEPAEEPHH
ncbi:MAG TPA: DUF6448 family protein [Armatimonadota bacterium]